MIRGRIYNTRSTIMGVYDRVLVIVEPAYSLETALLVGLLEHLVYFKSSSYSKGIEIYFQDSLQSIYDSEFSVRHAKQFIQFTKDLRQKDFKVNDIINEILYNYTQPNNIIVEMILKIIQSTSEDSQDFISKIVDKLGFILIVVTIESGEQTYSKYSSDRLPLIVVQEVSKGHYGLLIKSESLYENNLNYNDFPFSKTLDPGRSPENEIENQIEAGLPEEKSLPNHLRETLQIKPNPVIEDDTIKCKRLSTDVKSIADDNSYLKDALESMMNLIIINGNRRGFKQVHELASKVKVKDHKVFEKIERYMKNTVQCILCKDVKDRDNVCLINCPSNSCFICSNCRTRSLTIECPGCKRTYSKNEFTYLNTLSYNLKIE